MRFLVSALAICHHGAVSPFFGLCLFQTFPLVRLNSGGDDPQLLLGRHVAQRHLFEHRGKDIREQTQLADLANGKREGDRNRLLGPAESNKTFDARH
jgi:hypothetical protein